MNHQRGTAIMEIVVSIGLYMIIILIFGHLLNVFINLKHMVIENATPQQNLDYALQFMVTDIRSMGQSSVGSYPIEAASSSSLTFYSDINSDTLIERIRYFFTTSTTPALRKGVLTPSGNPLVYSTSSASEVIATVISDIKPNQGFFEYFDKNYTGTQAKLTEPINILNIKAISINLKVKSASFYTIITPRNLKFD